MQCKSPAVLFHPPPAEPFGFQIAEVHNSVTHKPWDLNVENIFRHIDIFIGRCHDMIEICQAMIDFAR